MSNKHRVARLTNFTGIQQLQLQRLVQLQALVSHLYSTTCCGDIVQSVMCLSRAISCLCYREGRGIKRYHSNKVVFLVKSRSAKKLILEFSHRVVTGAFFNGSMHFHTEIRNVLVGDKLILPHLISAAKRLIKCVELQQYFEVINSGTQNKA